MLTSTGRVDMALPVQRSDLWRLGLLDYRDSGDHGRRARLALRRDADKFHVLGVALFGITAYRYHPSFAYIRGRASDGRPSFAHDSREGKSLNITSKTPFTRIRFQSGQMRCA